MTRSFRNNHQINSDFEQEVAEEVRLEAEEAARWAAVDTTKPYCGECGTAENLLVMYGACSDGSDFYSCKPCWYTNQ